MHGHAPVNHFVRDLVHHVRGGHRPPHRRRARQKRRSHGNSVRKVVREVSHDDVPADGVQARDVEQRADVAAVDVVEVSTSSVRRGPRKRIYLSGGGGGIGVVVVVVCMI